MWLAIGSAVGWALGWIVTGLFAVAGWLVASFFAKPILDFLTLRGQVHEEIVFTGNIGAMTAHHKESYDQAVGQLRRLGAKAQAMNVSATPLLRWFLFKAGYDLATVGKNLIGLSNALDDYDGRVIHVNRIQIALDLPRDYTDEDIRQVIERKRNAHS
jgi:hypothetical protein